MIEPYTTMRDLRKRGQLAFVEAMKTPADVRAALKHFEGIAPANVKRHLNSPTMQFCLLQWCAGVKFGCSAAMARNAIIKHKMLEGKEWNGSAK